ncbi:MAG TPA: hypothetical protein VIR60_09140 [Gammaproteobacteria bacterium]
MKRLAAFVTFSVLSLGATAQNPAGMSDADREKMMQGMQAMQKCMADVDQAALERMSKEGEQMHAEVKALCADGKRDAAQARAMEYGKKIASDPAMKVMAECGKQMRAAMPQMQQTPGMPSEEELKNRHICDE